MKKIIFTIVTMLFSSWLLFAQPGSLDLSFNSGSASTINVFATAIQNDGKIIITGGFVIYNGVVTNYIARLNTDGSLDNSFVVGTGANNTVWAVALQNNGKIIIGGELTTYNGIATNYIARLNTDGTLDNSFNIGTGPNGPVRAITVQSDDKIIIGGGFSHFNGIHNRCIARLNADGSLDTTFDTRIGFHGGIVSTITIQSDGKYIIGGSFLEFDTDTSIARLTRLNTDGTLDNSFVTPRITKFFVYATAVQSDGKIIVGGDFLSPTKGLLRLNTDGSLDNSFNMGVGLEMNDPLTAYVKSISIQSDGRIIIGGMFNKYNGGVGRYGIMRFNADGSGDAVFNSGIGTGEYDIVHSVNLQGDGKIIIGGNFNSYNNTGINSIARLLNSSTSSTGFHTKGKVRFTVFPNPTSRILYIEEAEPGSIIELVDVLGKLIIKKQLSTNRTVDVQSLASGLYMIKVNGVVAGKVVKE